MAKVIAGPAGGCAVARAGGCTAAIARGCSAAAARGCPAAVARDGAAAMAGAGAAAPAAAGAASVVTVRVSVLPSGPEAPEPRGLSWLGMSCAAADFVCSAGFAFRPENRDPNDGE